MVLALKGAISGDPQALNTLHEAGGEGFSKELRQGLERLAPNEFVSLRNCNASEGIKQAVIEFQREKEALILNSLLDSDALKAKQRAPSELFQKIPTEGYYQYCHDILQLAGEIKSKIQELPPQEQATGLSRLKAAIEMADYGLRMRADDWKSDFVQNVTVDRLKMRNEGVMKAAEGKSYQLDENGGKLTSSNGIEFEGIRGKDSVTNQLKDYMEANGGSFELLQTWTSLQVLDSWIPSSQAFKTKLAEARNAPIDNYWMRDGLDTAHKHISDICSKVNFEAMKGKTIPQMQDYFFDSLEGKITNGPIDSQKNEAILDRTLQTALAFHGELLANIDIPGNNRKTGIVTLVRTEDASILEANGITPGETRAQMKRGPAESSSIGQSVSVSGSAVTQQKIPHHRILWSFIPALAAYDENSPNQGYSMQSSLGTDTMKEFLFMGEGIPFEYKTA